MVPSHFFPLKAFLGATIVLQKAFCCRTSLGKAKCSTMVFLQNKLNKREVQLFVQGFPCNSLVVSFFGTMSSLQLNKREALISYVPVCVGQHSLFWFHVFSLVSFYIRPKAVQGSPALF